VQVNGDMSPEPNDTFFVTVSNIVGATPGDAQGLGTIQNDDFSLTHIHDIQGSGDTSPFAGQSVTTAGIVTAVKGNGFFIQEAESDYDADANTSEGVFVFTSAAPPAAAAVGNLVTVQATVSELPYADPNSHADDRTDFRDRPADLDGQHAAGADRSDACEHQSVWTAQSARALRRHARAGQFADHRVAHRRQCE
jgi:predicted extracellular nuclease